MDLTPLAPVATVLATGFITLAGVWLNGRFTVRNEGRRIDAEEKRESARQAREDAQRDSDEEKAALVESKKTADVIAKYFLHELPRLRGFTSAEEGLSYAPWFQEQWRTRLEVGLRSKIAEVVSGEDRTRLLEVVDALDDFEQLADFNWVDTPTWVENTVILGHDLASAMARGQDPDEDTQARLNLLSQQVGSLESYRNDQREAEREARAQGRTS